jgi:hypothetical protein
MRPSNKDLFKRARSFMNPLRRLALESRPKRSPIVAPPKESKKHRLFTGPKPAWQAHPAPVAKPGPQLVQDPNKVQKLTHGDYEAAITVNRKSHPVLFHYILTKKDSPAILEWGQTISVHAAVAKSKAALKRLSAEDSAPGRMVAAD